MFGLPIYVIAAGACGVGLVVLLLLMRVSRKRDGGDDSKHLEHVRRLVASGKHKEAADLQRRKGKRVEAFNLLMRGEHNLEASLLAEELGRTEQAAALAEKGRDFERAADLYAQVEQWGPAGRLYQRTGNFLKAAESMEQDSDVDIHDIARMWENAYLAIMPQDKDTMTPAGVSLTPEARHCAERAAESFKRAGNNQRAATFFELVDKPELAHEMRARTMGSVMDKMSHTQLPTGESGGVTSGVSPFKIADGVTDHDNAASSNTLPTASLNLNPSKELAEMVSNAVQEAMRNQPMVVTQLPIKQVETEHGTANLLAPSQVVYIQDSRHDSQLGAGQEAPSQSPRINESRYQLLEVLGQGGMAIVYKALDTALEREVAIKFLPEGLTQNELALHFFEREARAAARLNHPNIVTIYDCGLMDDRPFISMEFVKGEAFDSLLKDPIHQRGLPLRLLLEVAEGLFQALSVAHVHGIVHRDVKPSNLMIAESGLIKLMDFGIATGNDANRETMIVGTPFYMAPEQFEGRGIDHRTDIFAAGATLYELATATLAFNSGARTQVPDAPVAFRPDLPRELSDLIQQCLYFEVSARPNSARRLLRIVRAMLNPMRAMDMDNDDVSVDFSEEDEVLDLTEQVNAPSSRSTSSNIEDEFKLQLEHLHEDYEPGADEPARARSPLNDSQRAHGETAPMSAPRRASRSTPPGDALAQDSAPFAELSAGLDASADVFDSDEAASRYAQGMKEGARKEDLDVSEQFIQELLDEDAQDDMFDFDIEDLLFGSQGEQAPVAESALGHGPAVRSEDEIFHDEAPQQAPSRSPSDSRRGESAVPQVGIRRRAASHPPAMHVPSDFADEQSFNQDAEVQRLLQDYLND